MDTTELLLFGKLHIVTEPGHRHAAAFATFQAHTDVVEDLFFPINDRCGDAIIAHQVDGLVKPIDIVWMHDDAQVMEAIVA